MTELEKKTLKAQTDLVQSVLEAHEKKNIERVDMLITNAIKQLKMSRFKPDQTTCISLTYLARVNPKIFTQSSVIKEVLKSLIRRDQVPTNIKGTGKTVDVVLPVLAANILLACCDTLDIRTLILNKIEQWICCNQKATGLVQHLLATLCMKCQNDEQTIGSLIEIRQYWLQYLEENYEDYGPVPTDLSMNVKKLLHSVTCGESLIVYLNFLIKHDTNIVELSWEVSKFILQRPISLYNMLKEEKYGVELTSILFRVYLKLIDHLKVNCQTDLSIDSKADLKLKLDSIYAKLPSCHNSLCISKLTTQAIFTLLALPVLENETYLTEDLKNLQRCWIVQVGKISHVAFMYQDAGLTIPYDLPMDLRLKLIHSSDELLVDLSIREANVGQLLALLQQFGLRVETINKIVERVESIQDVELIRAEVKDGSLFSQLMEFYTTIGCSKANHLKEKLQPSVIV